MVTRHHERYAARPQLNELFGGAWWGTLHRRALLLGIEEIRIAEQPLRELSDCDLRDNASLMEINLFIVLPVG